MLLVRIFMWLYIKKYICINYLFIYFMINYIPYAVGKVMFILKCTYYKKII